MSVWPCCPSLLAPHTTPGTWVFIIFYGLDWVATVPPTVMLCRDWFGAEVGPIVFGWVFASHQIGASIAAVGAGVIRDRTGSYDPAFYLAAGLCVVAAVLSLSIRAGRRPRSPYDDRRRRARTDVVAVSAACGSGSSRRRPGSPGRR